MVSQDSYPFATRTCNSSVIPSRSPGHPGRSSFALRTTARIAIRGGVGFQPAVRASVRARLPAKPAVTGQETCPTSRTSRALGYPCENRPRLNFAASFHKLARRRRDPGRTAWGHHDRTPASRALQPLVLGRSVSVLRPAPGRGAGVSRGVAAEDADLAGEPLRGCAADLEGRAVRQGPPRVDDGRAVAQAALGAADVPAPGAEHARRRPARPHPAERAGAPGV